MRSRLIGKKDFTSQFKEDGKGKTKSALTELNWEGRLRDSSKGEGEGYTEPVSVALSRGVRFAAEFRATRVKPGCC